MAIAGMEFHAVKSGDLRSFGSLPIVFDNPTS
jgi:hypothetical protein